MLEILPVALIEPPVNMLPPVMLPVTLNEVNVPTEVILACAFEVTVAAVVAAPDNAPVNVVAAMLVNPDTAVTVAPKVSAVDPRVTAALARRAWARVPVEILVALILDTLAPEPLSVPMMLPLVILPEVDMGLVPNVAKFAATLALPYVVTAVIPVSCEPLPRK